VSAQPAAPRSTLNPRDHLGDLAELKSVTELMQRRDFASAANRIESLLERNPGWSDLRDELGVAYQAMGNLPAAERTYREAIRRTPELASTFALSLASVLLDQGKFDDADAHARLALTANPGAAHELLGHIALARGNFDAALAEAKQAGDSLTAAFLVAQIHAAKNDLRNAVLTLQSIHNRSSAEKLPLPPDYYFFTGDVLARLGKTREARMAFEQQLRLTPQNTEAWVRMALLHRIEGNMPEARATLERMATLNPEARRVANAVLAEWGGG
jgi:tetratricopeptide (TPR) repeat protein